VPAIRLKTIIYAPIEVCFDLSRSIDFHIYSQSDSGETAVAGKTSGLIGPDEEVTWRAQHFLMQELTSRITRYDRPYYFRDSMTKGAFKRFDHDHRFTAQLDHTELEDLFDFDSPLGFLGKLVNKLFLTSYMTKMLESRNKALKETAESEVLWSRYLKPGHD
jgi:ligand-binding SRPBCC domain-containing protein